MRPQPARPQDPPHLPEPARPNPYPAPEPLAAQPPRGPVPDFPPPGFEDEYEVNRPPRGPLHVPGTGPGFGNIGHDDLYPAGLGPHDPIRGTFAPQGGIGPMGLPRPHGGGGMHPTFDDPLFGGPRGGDGDDGFGGQLPPGARYDPVGPGGQPRFGGGRPGGRGGGGFGGFGGFGGGDIV